MAVDMEDTLLLHELATEVFGPEEAASVEEMLSNEDFKPTLLMMQKFHKAKVEQERIKNISRNGNNGEHYMELTTGLLSSLELKHLVEQGVIEGVKPESINAASIDLHLGDRFLHEADVGDHSHGVVNLAKREKPRMYEELGYTHLMPGDFCLASTREIFHLPDNISGMFILKSSMARAGLEHSQAGWADAGWHGSALTLELSNLLRNHTLRLEAGMAIGQIILFRHTPVPDEFSYATRGHYNNDRSVTEMKS